MSICPYCTFRIGKNNRIKVNGTWEHKCCPKEEIEHKKKITNELIRRSNTIFNKKSMILTGEGLTRTELRLLERRGRIKKSYRKYGSGTLRCVWMRPATLERLKATDKEKKRKDKELEELMKRPEALKVRLNIFKRLWNFIKKIFGGKNGTARRNPKKIQLKS